MMLFEQIRALQVQLPPAESKVAAYLLAQPQGFLQSPVVAIAKAAQVSQPTVIRFCRSLGSTGLKDFKLQLAAALNHSTSKGSQVGPHPSVSAGDSIPELTAKVIEAGIQALQSLPASLDLVVVKKIVDAFLLAKRVDFVGIGQSALVAQDAKQKFFRFGLHCEAYSDPALQVMSASQLSKKDILVLVSASGLSPELFDVVQIARQTGARILSIGAPGSRVSHLADWVLNAQPQEDPDVHMPMLGRLQHLMIIDVLAVALAQRIGAKSRGHLQDLKRTLVARRGDVQDKKLKTTRTG
jgi:DNA-binding MurR/RpiR family transcriptional regulator